MSPDRHNTLVAPTLLTVPEAMAALRLSRAARVSKALNPSTTNRPPPSPGIGR